MKHIAMNVLGPTNTPEALAAHIQQHSNALSQPPAEKKEAVNYRGHIVNRKSSCCTCSTHTKMKLALAGGILGCLSTIGGLIAFATIDKDKPLDNKTWVIGGFLVGGFIVAGACIVKYLLLKKDMEYQRLERAVDTTPFSADSKVPVQTVVV